MSNFPSHPHTLITPSYEGGMTTQAWCGLRWGGGGAYRAGEDKTVTGRFTLPKSRLRA